MLKYNMINKIYKISITEKDKFLRVLEKFNMLFPFKHLYIQTENNKIICATDSHISSIFATFAIDLFLNENICTDFSIIYSVFRNISEFNLEIKNNLLYIISDKSIFNINLLSKTFTTFNTPDNFYPIKKGVEKAFKFALIAIGDLHNNMKITTVRNDVFCIATDSMRLSCSKISTLKLPECNLPKDFVNFLLKLLNEQDILCFSKMDNSLFLKWNDKIYPDIEFILKIADGVKHVPDNYSNIILQDKSQEITVDAQKLKDILIKALIFTNENFHIKFEPQENNIKISASSQEKGKFSASLEGKISTNAQGFIINGKILLDVLTKDLTTIQLIGHAPITVPLADNFYVFMPIEV